MGVCSVLQLQASRGQGVPEPARIAPRAAGDSKSMDSSAGSSSEPPSWRPAAAAGGEQCKAAAATHLKYRIDQQQQRQRRVLRSNGRWPVPMSGEMCQSIGQGGWPAISVVAACWLLLLPLLAICCRCTASCSAPAYTFSTRAPHLHLLSILRPVVAALLLISSPPSEGSPLSPAANKPSLSCALQHPDCRLPPPRSGEFKRMHFCIVNKNTYNLMCRAWQDYHFFACPDAEIFIWSAGLSPIFHKFIYRVKPR